MDLELLSLFLLENKTFDAIVSDCPTFSIQGL